MSAGGGAGARVAALDGLRGWASLSVVVFHMTWETFGKLFPDFRTLPAALLGNGTFAVALFLMVSGYVLTIRGWRSRDKGPVRRSILKRYFRLTPPILGSVLLFWAVVALGLCYAQPAGSIVERQDWLMQFGAFQPNLLDAIAFGTLTVYQHTDQYSYGPFLWTMTVEFWGSFLVLVLCWFELPGRWSYVPLGVVTVIVLFMPLPPFAPVAACYTAGALVALLVKDAVIHSGAPSPRESAIASMVVAGSLVVVAVAEILDLPKSVTTVVAMITFVAVLRSTLFSRLLSAPLSQWLGRLSFPLYLVQISVLVSLTSWLIVMASGAGVLTPLSALGIAVLSVSATVGAAWLFMPVERAALLLAGYVGRIATERPASRA